MWDQHTHCEFSGDSTAPARDMVQAAIDAGLEGICFTDHHDIDYPSTPDEDEFDINYDEYFPALKAVKEEFADRISVHIGVELGLQPHVGEKNAQFMQGKSFDFCIGSVHVIRGKDPYYGGFFDKLGEKEAFRAYFEDTIEGIRAFDGFDVLGHIGYLVRYAPNKRLNYHPSDYWDLIDIILKTLIEKGKGIECNTSGYRGGLDCTIPGEEVLKRYKDLGGEIITIGSDAHRPEDVAMRFDVVKPLLTRCGFTHYAVFTARKPEFFPL